MANILITGGSGLVGKVISQLLLAEGHKVRWLTRKPNKKGEIAQFKWDLNTHFIDEKAFEHLDGIVHLAGAGIVDKRWSESYKKEIFDSRVKSSELLFDYIKKIKPPLSVFVGGSAVGYYGSQNSHSALTETDVPGNDFLSDVCVAWEKSYEAFSQIGIRTSILRTGIVLSNQGGAYKQLKPIFNLGFGAAIGTGRQAFPWIHLYDLANIFVTALRDESFRGIYNAVANEQVTNVEFSKLLAKSLHRPFFMPKIPTRIMHFILGERAITITKGATISNSKLKNTSFKFKFERLKLALDDLKKSTT